MWSSLTIASPCASTESTINELVPPSNDDPFFNELMKKNDSPTKTLNKTKEPVKKTCGSLNEDSDDWDVDGWEVSSMETPQNKSISRQSSAATPETPQLQQMTNTVMEELREYMLNFADPRATLELNEDLNEKPFSALLAYYATRPELAAYTVDHEGYHI